MVNGHYFVSLVGRVGPREENEYKTLMGEVDPPEGWEGTEKQRRFSSSTNYTRNSLSPKSSKEATGLIKRIHWACTSGGNERKSDLLLPWSFSTIHHPSRRGGEKSVPSDRRGSCAWLDGRAIHGAESSN